MKQKRPVKRNQPRLDLETWLTPPLPKVMGILNVTRESFFDGGRYISKENALDHALKIEKHGADVIDVGGESTRPGSKPVSLDEELNRVIPVIEQIRKRTDILISVDTTKSQVAKLALDNGANIINDVSALRADPDIVNIAAEYDVPVIIMHMIGTPKTMQESVSYENCLEEICSFLVQRSDKLVKQGIKQNRIIFDPGIGFGKKLKHNLTIIKNTDYFVKTGFPVLVGPSRKSFIGELLNNKPDERLSGTLSALVWALEGGAKILRVHDVKEVKEFFTVYNAIKDSKTG